MRRSPPSRLGTESQRRARTARGGHDPSSYDIVHELRLTRSRSFRRRWLCGRRGCCCRTLFPQRFNASSSLTAARSRCTTVDCFLIQSKTSPPLDSQRAKIGLPPMTRSVQLPRDIYRVPCVWPPPRSSESGFRTRVHEISLALWVTRHERWTKVKLRSGGKFCIQGVRLGPPASRRIAGSPAIKH
jgi:hypothetical protein